MTRPAGLPWGNGLAAVADALRERAETDKPTARLLVADLMALARALDDLRADVDLCNRGPAAADKGDRGLTLTDTCERLAWGGKVEWR